MQLWTDASVDYVLHGQTSKNAQMSWHVRCQQLICPLSHPTQFAIPHVTVHCHLATTTKYKDVRIHKKICMLHLSWHVRNTWSCMIRCPVCHDKQDQTFVMTCGKHVREKKKCNGNCVHNVCKKPGTTMSCMLDGNPRLCMVLRAIHCCTVGHTLGTNI